MEIVFKKNDKISIEDKKLYYDEVLYVCAFYKKIIEKPEKKICGITKYIINSLIVIICYILLLGIMISIFANDFLPMAALCIFGIVIIMYYIRLLVIYKKKINDLLNDQREAIVNIDKDKIMYNDSNQTINFKWDNIEIIVANKYSITFIPNTPMPIILSLPIAKKDKIFSAIKAAGHESLIVDNGEKY